MPFSSMDDRPVDEVPSVVLGGVSNGATDAVPENVLGGASNTTTELTPANVLGGISNSQVDAIPGNVLGGISNTLGDYIPANTLGGSSNSSATSTAIEVSPPRSLVTSRSYTAPQRDVIHRPASPQTGMNLLLTDKRYGLYAAPSNRALLVEAVVLVCTAGTGVSVDATVSLGTTTSPASVLGATGLAQFRTADKVFVLKPRNAISAEVPASAALVLTVVTPASGTTLDVSANVLGSLI